MWSDPPGWANTVGGSLVSYLRRKRSGINKENAPERRSAAERSGLFETAVSAEAGRALPRPVS
jgi:hypothetical protein